MMTDQGLYYLWLYESGLCSSKQLLALHDLCGAEIQFGTELKLLLKEKSNGYDLSRETYDRFASERDKMPERQVVLYWDSDYPEALKEIYDPPAVLYCAGRRELLQNTNTLAMVGSRNPSEYGKKCAYSLAKDLTSLSYCIVSGFAMGIDATAHLGALDGGGETIAILGAGLDLNYPVVNQNLRKRMEDEGLVISEFPYGTPALAHHFPQRNRIISGLSQGVLVVEAALNSGSLITAKLALDQNRDVFAVPGDIFKGKSQGGNQLIRDGANLITSAHDIYRFYGHVDDKPSVEKVLKNDLQVTIVNLLSQEGPLNFDALFDATDCEMGELMLELFYLESQGVIEQGAGQMYDIRVT